jgi:protocatechuate 3,4-dioxygenase beta subunit
MARANDDPTSGDGLTRRTTLMRAGGLAAVAFGATGRQDALACVLAPEMTEGPYYLPGEKVRRDIGEGLAGAPLGLRLTVLDASTCRPIKGAAVDVWHASAAGKYSGEQANDTVGSTFLRGIQRTDSRGLALFKTVYPGWYPGRAVHIHVKVHAGGNVVHTGQLFFRDAFSDAVYRRSPYNRRGARDVRNTDDSIYRDGGSRSLLSMRSAGTGYVGSISMGVRR